MKKINLTPAQSRLVYWLGLLTAALLTLGGLVMIIYPYYVHWQQDRLSSQLAASFDKGQGVIEVGSDDWAVAGEESDTLDQIEPGSDLLDQPSSLPGMAGDLKDTSSSAPGTSATSAKPANVKVYAIGKIIIPKIELTMPVAEGATDVSLRVAIGRYAPSAKLGANGQSVLLGHRMYTYGRFFNRLDELAVDDPVQIETRTERLNYQVTQTEVVLPEDLGKIFSREYETPYLLLVTCTPVRIADHRLLVTCKLVSREPLNGPSATTTSAIPETAAATEPPASAPAEPAVETTAASETTTVAETTVVASETTAPSETTTAASETTTLVSETTTAASETTTAASETTPP